MKFLKSLIQVDEIPLVRNQNLIIKALHERASSTMVLFNTPEEIEIRDKLINTKKYKTDPEGVLVSGFFLFLKFKPTKKLKILELPFSFNWIAIILLPW